jgi:hypothetical protein
VQVFAVFCLFCGRLCPQLPFATGIIFSFTIQNMLYISYKYSAFVKNMVFILLYITKGICYTAHYLQIPYLSVPLLQTFWLMICKDTWNEKYYSCSSIEKFLSDEAYSD